MECVGIIVIGNIRYCPFLKKYLSALEKGKIKYKVLYWEREEENVDYNQEIYYSFKHKSKLDRSAFSKIFDFIKFRRWVISKVQECKFDKLILLTTLTGVFLFDFLMKNYKGKYIFDIRDYSYENYKIFKFIEKMIVKNSYFTSISSDAFKNFLPKSDKYINCHNLVYNDLQYVKKICKNKKLKNIKVVWNGTLRYFEHQKKIIDKLGNDNRFTMIYHGSGPEEQKYRNYVSQKGYSNIFFTGAYKNEDKHLLLEGADILNNSYGTGDQKKIKDAMANRLYDGLIYQIPQLVEVNTYKTKIVSTNEIGISLSLEESEFSNKLFSYYNQINDGKFSNSCKKLLDKYLSEDRKYLRKIKKFVEMNSYE